MKHHKLFIFTAMLALTGLFVGLAVFNQPAQAAIIAEINFQDPATIPPGTYLRDNGEAYGVRGGANQAGTYGWVTPGTTTPLDLSVGGSTPGNGRDRNNPADERLATFMHMQYGGGNGTPADGAWEYAIANGNYTVDVSVGDSGFFDSIHMINVEGVNAINGYVPSGGAGAFANAQITVAVNDGRLTIDAIGGTNTKINYVIIQDAIGPVRPSVNGVNPANGSTGVPVNSSITAQPLFIPNGGVSAPTVTPATVYLYPTAGNPNTDRVPVSSVNTTGGGDAITLVPATTLLPNTNYTFVITDGVEDISGADFIPFTSTFTTGGSIGGGGSGISFTQVNLGGVTTSLGYNSLEVGPGGTRLYATTRSGALYHWDINPADGTLSNQTAINALGSRFAIGLDFDPASTATNPILWVSHNSVGINNQPIFSGAISRLVGTNVGTGGENWVATQYVSHLPRSFGDHMTNSVQFGPDGALYVLQGGQSAMGEATNLSWGNRPETVLAGALLRVDTAALIGGGPISVRTGITDGNGVDGTTLVTNYGLGELAGAGLYDPQAPGAPLTIYASGIRNAYDLTWHSNGRLYVAANGSAGGNNDGGGTGMIPNTPADPNTVVACQNRIDGTWNGPQATLIHNLPDTQPDLLFNVVAGRYYGHPNPSRCEWIMNGGNPTAGPDIGQAGNHYTVGTAPDPNWGGIAFNFQLNKSPNGMIEYRNAAAFGGALQGRILVVRYSQNDDIIVLTPGGATGNIVASEESAPGMGGFSDPLDLIEDVATGNIYVIEYGNQGNGSTITLLRPNLIQAGDPNIEAAPSPMAFSDVVGGGSSNAQTLTITNSGIADLIISNFTLGGANAANFNITTAPGVPTTVTPGNSVQVQITYTASAVALQVGYIQIDSNDPDTPSFFVNLQGQGLAGTGGNNEPSLQAILDAFNININVGDDDSTTTPINGDGALANYPGNQLGQEVALQSMVVANPANPITVEVLASFAVNGNPPVIAGWYPTSDPNNRTEVFRTVQNDDQTFNPGTVGPLSFNNPGVPFGLFTQYPPAPWNGRVAYSQDFLNTWDPVPLHRHKMRAYELRDAVGTIIPNAYVVGWEEYTQGWDYNDVVFIVRNVNPAPILPGGVVGFENLDWATPFNPANNVNFGGMNYLNRWLTAHHILNPSPNNGGTLLTHEIATLRIRNDSPAQTLTLTGLVLSDPAEWALVNAPAMPYDIAPGGFYDLQVQFIANTGGRGTRIDTLTVESSASNEPSAPITLAGGYMTTDEGNAELSKLEVLEAFGITTNLGNILNSNYVASSADEVLAFEWTRTDPTQAVYVRQLAAFHGCCSGQEHFTVTGPGGGTFNHHQSFGQSLLPAIAGNINAPAEMVVYPTSPNFTMNAAQGTFSTNHCQGVPGCDEHGLRIYHLRDNNGVLVPDVFVAIQDFVGGGCIFDGGSNGNCDYNDDIYLISNVQPATVLTDVTVDITDSVDPVVFGNNVTLTVTAENSSNFSAHNTEVVITLPPEFAVVTITPPAGVTCNQVGQVITCDVGIIGAQTTAAINIVVNPTAGGIFTTNATITTTTTETDGTNNDASEQTQVNDPNNLPGTITIVKDAQPDSAQAFNFTGDLGNFSLTDDGGVPVPFQADINFQLGGAPVPAGYIEDSGLAYADRGNGFFYGWLDQGTNTPVDGSGDARDRNRGGIAQELDTLMHMQLSGNYYWEIAVPNGVYDVTVSVGDQPLYDSTHFLNVEGTNAINGFVSTGGAEYSQATVSVTVNDGLLTIDAIGGTNTKINYVEILQTGGTTFNQQTFTVLPGTYNVSEVVPAGWNLTGATCVGGTFGSITNGVSVQLTNAGAITCTFTNTQITGSAVDIQKTPDNQNVVTNGTANFTIDVSNIGLDDLTVNSVVDDTCDAAPVYVSGDNGDNILNVGETWQYTCSVANVVTNFTNTASVTATGGSGVVNDSDIANVVVLPPAEVDLIKNTSTPNLAPGATANFTITIENTGALDVTVTSLTDDTCDAAPVYVSGDLNTDNELDSGETWLYTCSVANVATTFTNTATVNVQEVGGPSTATDSDTATVTVTTTPAIDLVKNADAPVVLSGDTATFTITAQNTGNAPLTVDSLTDDTCDAAPAFGGGDTNGNNQLDVGETWTYTCSVANVLAGFTNTATVSATEIGGASVVVGDTDTATVAIGGIAIDKTPDNQIVTSGNTANFTITVTNTGEVDLTTVNVTDNTCDAAPVLTGGDTDTDNELDVAETWTYTCSFANVNADFTNTATATANAGTLAVNAVDTANVTVFINAPSVVITKTTTTPNVPYGTDVTFDIHVENNGNVDLTNVGVLDAATPSCDNTIGNLAIGQAVDYTCVATAVTADFTNTAIVSATDPGANIISDNSSVDVTVTVNEGIAIDKTPDNSSVQSGTDVLFTLTVTNTGNVPLNTVTVTDDTCTTAVTFDGGDTNTDNILDVTETWTYSCTVANAVLDFTNTATAEGTAPSTNVVNATDSATVNVLQAPAITIDKTPLTQTVTTGGTASFTLSVNNTGDVPLNTVTVTDGQCDAAPVLVSGDTNTDGFLDITETWEYTCETTNVVAPFTNTATVIATAPDGVTNVNDLANATVAVNTVNTPAVSINVTPPVQTVNSGGTASFTIDVSNIGAFDLINVVITEDICDVAPVLTGGDTDTDGELDQGEVWTYTCDATNIIASAVGTFTVDAEGNAIPVTATDTAIVGVNGSATPLIAIDKTPNNQTVNSGDTATFTLTVTNIGGVDLLNVVVTDNTCTTPVVFVGGDTDTDNELDLAETWTYTCDVVNVTQPFTNTATVTAEDTTPTQVTASDSAVVLVNGVVGSVPAIDISVSPTTQDVVNGDTATVTITVTNIGNVVLDNVVITDTATGSTCPTTIPTINVGEVVTINCTIPNVTTTTTNTFTVVGTDTASGVTVNDSVAVIINVVDAPAPPTQQFSAFDPFITKNAFPPFAIPGEAVTFIFYVSNPGNVPADNVVAIDPIPAEVEILGVTQTAGTTTVNGQDVIFSINQLLPNETITVTIETRVRDNVATPFVIVNEVCMNADNMPSQRCDTATVISVTTLPSTGETPIWSMILRHILTLFGATLVAIGMGWTGRRVYLRTR